MIKSVFKQDYTNYKISFIDDHSPANIIEKVKELFIQEKSKAKNKNKMIEVHEQYNKAQVYSLKNRYDSLVNHCSEDDIVLDVDADDELVGNKVFQLVNTLYRRNKNVWAVYLNHFYREYDSKGNPEMKDTNLGQIPDETFEKNCYRTSYSWKTTALKSYRRKLFMKIDPTDYLDSEDKFYIEKADTFVHFALV